MPPKPKPVKADRKALKEKSVIKVSMAKRKKIAEKQLEGITKMIIAWRDGQDCVMKGRGKCGNGLMWNHLVSQNKSPYLRYELGNVFWGCGVHNFEDRFGSTVMPAWFVSVFGSNSFEAMDRARQENIGRKHSLAELEEMLAHYDELYQNRYTIHLDIYSLVKAGYYGEIVKTAWIG